MSNTADLSGTTEFAIGEEVWCIDGVCGELRRVVVDPIRRVVTHLVVDGTERKYRSHLVPIELVDTAARRNQLTCTIEQFEEIDPAEETRFLKGASGEWGYAPAHMLSQPYFGLQTASDAAMRRVAGAPVAEPEFVTYDRVPVGDVEIRRGDRVQATDGPIGTVQGLVIDPGSFHVTHVLLDDSNFWGRKQVAIPISEVSMIDEGVHVKLSKEQIRELPTVDVDRSA